MNKSFQPAIIFLNNNRGELNSLRIRILSILFLLLLFHSSLFSQNAYNLSQFTKETFRFAEQPAKWEESDWLKLGLISAGTVLLLQADQPFRDIVLKDQSYYKSFPIEVGRIWGEGYPTAILAGAFGLHGLLTNDNTSKKIGFEIVQSVIYAGAITTFLKIAVGRARPFTNRGAATFKPFSLFDDDFHSFPSGHTTLAFTLSTVLSKNLKSDLLKIIAYIPAVLTVVSRVYQDNHWASDVFASAAISYFVGDWVVNQHEEKNTSIETTSIFPLSFRIAIY